MRFNVRFIGLQVLRQAIRELGLVYHPIDVALVDMANALIAKGLATPVHKHPHPQL
jgi:hypothetical protein